MLAQEIFLLIPLAFLLSTLKNRDCFTFEIEVVSSQVHFTLLSHEAVKGVKNN